MKQKVAIILTACLLILMGGSPLYAGQTDSIDIDDAKKEALLNNPSIKAVKSRIKQAAESVKQARSTFFPTIDAQYSVTRNDYSDNSLLVAQDHLYSTGLTATLVLFDSFNRSFTLKSAKYAEMLTIEAEKDAVRQLTFSVAMAFYHAQLARENIAIAKMDKAYYENQLADARIKKEAGSGALSDVLGFQIQVNSSEVNIIQYQKEYTIALTGLAAIIGYSDAVLPDGTAISPLRTTPIGDIGETAPEQLIQEALNNRPDLKQYQFALNQAHLGIKAARSDYFPILSLAGSYNGSRENDSRFDNDDLSSSIGLNLTVNLFSGGMTNAKIAEAKALRREVGYSLKSYEISVKEDVIRACSELDSSKKQLLLQLENTELAKKSRDIVETEYKEGVTSYVRLTEAQNILVQNRGRLAQARVGFFQAEEMLKTATAMDI